MIDAYARSRHDWMTDSSLIFVALELLVKKGKRWEPLRFLGAVLIIVNFSKILSGPINQNVCCKNKCRKNFPSNFFLLEHLGIELDSVWKRQKYQFSQTFLSNQTSETVCPTRDVNFRHFCSWNQWLHNSTKESLTVKLFVSENLTMLWLFCPCLVQLKFDYRTIKRMQYLKKN